ncbi:MAG TPA: hypothetical protein VNA31_02465 [bacterium]|nr:hypothetical protein [bacterium]
MAGLISFAQFPNDRIRNHLVDLLSSRCVGPQMRLGQIGGVPFGLAVEGAMGYSMEHGVAESGVIKSGIESVQRGRCPLATFFLPQIHCLWKKDSRNSRGRGNPLAADSLKTRLQCLPLAAHQVGETLDGCGNLRVPPYFSQLPAQVPVKLTLYRDHVAQELLQLIPV